VQRFSPILHQQAQHRLARSVRRFVGPEDVLNDAWASVLPRIGGLRETNANVSVALLKYLTTVVLNRCNELSRRYALGEQIGGGTYDVTLGDLTIDTTGVVSRAMRNEAAEELAAGFDRLEEADREVLVLRGIEQRSLEEVARLTGCSENTVSQRYRRACGKLGDRLPRSLVAFD